MNSVASTLNRVTDMEFNNQISVLTPNNWNTWKHDMQVLLMHYGCWQFIVQTKPEQPDEEATYKEKLDLQLRKDRCYTLIYTNISSDLKNLITETTDGVAAWKILKDHFEPVTRARRQPDYREAGHKLDDLYIGFQLIRWLPSGIPVYRATNLQMEKEDFRVVKIEAELILEANRLQLMKQDLEKAENAYLSSFTSKKSKTLPGATAAAHGNPNGKNDYQKKSDLKPITNMKMSLATEDKSCPVEGIGTLRFRVKYKGSFHEITLTDVLFNPKLRRNLLSGSRLESKGAHFVGTKGRKPSVLHLKPFGCLAYAGVPKQIRKKKKFDMRVKMGIMMGYAQRTKGYRIWLINENKLVETINVRFDENKRGINFRQKVNSNLGYNLNLPDYYDDEDDSDRVKDSLTSRLVSKTSTETPSTSEKPDVSSDNHSLIPCTEVKWIRNIGRKVTGSNVYYSIEGEATRLKSFNEIERYCKRHNIKYDPSLFNFRKDNTESQGFSDLSEQQEALMVEVTIPNCYKQAIRSRDASKWHDAMDKEINVMKERKVWDLVDHPDNIKILENRWVYTIKYDENNKIVRYKARFVARGNTQLRSESFDEVFHEYKLELSKVKSLKLRCYSDSDFATNGDDRVSMGGFITFIDETPISSRTFKQKSVILSTMEAESHLFAGNIVEIVRIDTSPQVFVSGSNLYTGGIFVDGSLKNTPLQRLFCYLFRPLHRRNEVEKFNLYTG
ncbi:hypothetical protein TNCV_4022291 [Trichonephila clavipes]|nr:hypothetical protein TNCV_4022291 [Trichonephila clavipes]